MLSQFSEFTEKAIGALNVYKLSNGHITGSQITDASSINNTDYSYGNEPDPSHAGTDYFNVFYFVSASSINTGSSGYELCGTTAGFSSSITVSLHKITGSTVDNMYAVKVKFPEYYDPSAAGTRTYQVGISLSTNDPDMSPHNVVLSISHTYCKQ